MSRILATILTSAFVIAGCGGGGGSASGPRQVGGPPAAGESLIVSGGSVEIPADAVLADPTSFAVRSQLGIASFERSFTITTPVNAPLDLAFTATAPGARGTVSVKVALVGGARSPAVDLAAEGLAARAGALIDAGSWVETVGDGFARLTLSGAIARDVVLAVERSAGGRRTHSVVALRIGPRGPANPVVPPGSGTYAGLKSTTPLFSSDSPIFGLPAIAASGDRVSVVCYDSIYVGQPAPGPGPGPGPGIGAPCVMPDVERRQRRLQVDANTGAATQGETASLGNDATSWRDTEVAGLFNVIAIAQSGDDGVAVSLSFDRGESFPQTIPLAPGLFSRLVAIEMASDYTTGILFWGYDMTAQSHRLTFVEGRPSAYDQNASPSAFAFGAPRTLLDRGSRVVPLVSDLQYTSCGDLFVAFGMTEIQTWPDPAITTVGCFRRLNGETVFTGPTIADQMEIFGYDPAIAVTGCGTSAQVFIAFESQAGVAIRRSADGGASFPTVARTGSTSANAPRIFARPQGGGTVVDCVYLDASPAGFGSELCLFRADGDLATNRSVHRLVEARLIPGTSGQQEVDSVGWFGFDATELSGDLFVACHVQRMTYWSQTRVMMSAAPGGAAAASAPAVLYPGMTQPVPAFNASAVHRLSILRLE